MPSHSNGGTGQEKHVALLRLRARANKRVRACVHTVARHAVKNPKPPHPKPTLPKKRWTRLEADPRLQLYTNYGLGAAYAAIAIVALAQLARIQLRVPEYGWTTQKVFHLLNALVAGLRAASFLARPQMDALHPDVLRLVLYDLPGKEQSAEAAGG
jgi:hypothetical protein